MKNRPLVIDEVNVVRFKENKIVRFLLEDGPFDLNTLAVKGFSDEDHAEFAQLIGYSVSGWGSLPYVKRRDALRADQLAEKLFRKKAAKGRRG